MYVLPYFIFSARIDDFNVDLIYGRNIYGENANWITLATIVRFHVGQLWIVRPPLLSIVTTAGKAATIRTMNLNVRFGS
jgi:hypothetical protein